MIDSLEPDDGKKPLESAYTKASKKTNDIKLNKGRPDRDDPINDEDILNLKIDLATSQSAKVFIDKIGDNDE